MSKALRHGYTGRNGDYVVVQIGPGVGRHGAGCAVGDHLPAGCGPTSRLLGLAGMGTRRLRRQPALFYSRLNEGNGHAG
jgi:hypothetical protein